VDSDKLSGWTKQPSENLEGGQFSSSLQLSAGLTRLRDSYSSLYSSVVIDSE
jgi:hypothetical protein